MEITTVIQENSGFSVAQFNLKELLERIEDVKLAIFQNIGVDCLVTRPIEKHLKMGEIPNEDIVLFYSRDIETCFPPIRGTNTSAAEYFVWDEDTGILFQRIPTNRYTSCNYHTIGVEKFYNIKRKSSICVCLPEKNSFEGFENLENGNSVIMPPGYCHSLYAPSGPAYNVILMPPGTGRSDHHYPEKCPKQLHFLLPERCRECYVK